MFQVIKVPLLYESGAHKVILSDLFLVSKVYIGFFQNLLSNSDYQILIVILNIVQGKHLFFRNHTTNVIIGTIIMKKRTVKV